MLLRLKDQYRQIEDLYLAFAKKASAFNSWFENAEEDLTDPVRCNSVEEIRVRLVYYGGAFLTTVIYYLWRGISDISDLFIMEGHFCHK